MYNPTFIGDIDLNEDTLEHYGVMGMKWGVRKDLRSTGKVSKKTKSKITEAVRKSKREGKARRMLNGLEDLRADYKGEREYHKSKKNSAGVKDSEKTIREIEGLSSGIKSEAKKKGYSYNKTNRERSTMRSRSLVSAANTPATFIGGPLAGMAAGAAATAYTKKKDKDYREATGAKNSQYWVYDTDYYKKKK